MPLIKGSIGFVGTNPSVDVGSIGPVEGDWILICGGASVSDLKVVGVPVTRRDGGNVGICIHAFRWGGGATSFSLPVTQSNSACRLIVLDRLWRPVGQAVATAAAIADPGVINFPVSGPHTVITYIGGRGSSVTTCTAPTNYTLIGSAQIGSSAFAAAAFREVDAASENPGPFVVNGSNHDSAAVAIAFAPQISVAGRGLIGADPAEGAEVVVVGEWDDDFYVAGTAAVDAEGDWTVDAEWAEKYWAMARFDDGEDLHTAPAHHSITP